MKLYTVTVDKCIACGKCELACGFAHGKDGKAGQTRINIIRRGVEAGTPIVCFQCVDAACVKSCNSNALIRNEATGAIDVDYSKCKNCKSCVAACPFGNMKWDDDFRIVHKCDLCGGDPQCVPFCPTGALEYVTIPSESKSA
ncbi:MAG TPA: 4Fe-4S dicluster domain-containing protein [Thermoanaerobaculia bacterium]|nr:4Fe-4S dicluster domain-containing protein [Thermoanaerobaculia bacterium]HUM30327.1 4Fe-4S dicluster domain-containing protein [Thermoanaerobaculia bacterium]HXK68522.1 4Fe-4S dicluster domain-containing protein [Thermoanaerobaculia bacterium]